MNVFLTGATGLLGGHIADLLVKDGHHVTLLLRQGLPGHLKKLTQVAICPGDLSDLDCLSRHLEGADVVIHAAADVSMNVCMNKRQFDTNVTGLVNLIKASQHARVKRFVYVSTAGVFRAGNSLHPATEAEKITDEKRELPYIRTKLEAERFLLGAFKEDGFPCIILNPTFMIGPEDHKPSSGQLILAVLKKRMFFYPSGGKNVIDVRDAAQAVVNAMTLGKTGENYILANENVSYRDLFQTINDAGGMHLRFRKAPVFFMKLLGYLGTLIELWTRKPMQVNHLTVQVSLEEHYFSSAKARQELRLVTRPLEQTISETVSWIRDRFTGTRALKEADVKHPALSPAKH